MSLRLIPQLDVIRPADANETTEAWAYAIQNLSKPTALILSRQNLPTLDRGKYAPAAGLVKGAYVLYESDPDNSDLILIATGSEVSLAIGALPQLESQGIKVRVVSFPSWELFDAQTEQYRQSVFPKTITKRLSIEAGVTTGWQKWVGCEGASIGIDRFGASAPGERVMQEFGFTVENVVEKALKLINE